MSPSMQAGKVIWVIFIFTLIDKSFTHSTFRHGARHHNHHHLLPTRLDETSEDNGRLSVNELHDHKMDTDEEFEDDFDKMSAIHYKEMFRARVNREYRRKYENLLTQNARLRDENRRLRNQNTELISEDREIVFEDRTLLKENDELKEKNRVKNQNLLKEYSVLHHEYDELRQDEDKLRHESKRLLDEDKELFEESKKLVADEREFHEEKSQLYDEILLLHEKYDKLLSEYDELRKQMMEFHRCCLDPKTSHNIQSKSSTENSSTLCKDCSELLRKTELREMLSEGNYDLQKFEKVLEKEQVALSKTQFAKVDTYHHNINVVTEDSVPHQPDQSEKNLNNIQNEKVKHELPSSTTMITDEKIVAKKDETMIGEEHRNITRLQEEEDANMEIQYGEEDFKLAGNFSWEFEDRSKAFDHMVQVTDFTTCDKPIPQVFAIQDLVSDKRRYYSPQATVLHRCGRQSGCCANEFLSCVPAKKERVELFFFMVKFNGSEIFGPVVEKLHLTNHTKCGCVYKEQEKDYLE